MTRVEHNTNLNSCSDYSTMKKGIGKYRKDAITEKSIIKIIFSSITDKYVVYITIFFSEITTKNMR